MILKYISIILLLLKPSCYGVNRKRIDFIEMYLYLIQHIYKRCYLHNDMKSLTYFMNEFLN